MKIFIDSREDSAVLKAFKRSGIEFEVKTLLVGDFICLEKPQACVEHKSIFDLISSFNQGHISKQLLQMQENFKYNLLVIKGDWKQLAFSPVQCSVAQKVGMLVSLAVRYSVKIIQVDNNDQLALAVQSFFNKVDDGKEITIRDTELLKNRMSNEDMVFKMACCWHGYGIKKASKFFIKHPEIKLMYEEIVKKMEELQR